jgi:NADPH:quinone reductase-like Zn-dependent oxidoreductase
MKAMVYSEYGAPDVLKLQEVDKPVAKDNEMLIKMRAATVSSGDARLRALNVTYGFNFITKLAMGFGKPRNGILGVELAGEVEAVGKDVTLFKVGDKVFGANGSTGAYAQYATIAEDGAVATLPGGMSFEQAAAVPFGALSSLIFLRDMGKVQSGQKVLINGASGGLGTFAVQLAVAPLPSIFRMLWTALFSSKKMVWGVAMFNKKDLEWVKNLIEKGELQSTIEKVYPLEQMVEAHTHVDTGHKKGGCGDQHCTLSKGH